MSPLTEQQKQQALMLLRELVAIPSVNVGMSRGKSDRPEERIAQFLTDQLESLGMTVERREVSPGRPNLTAHWPEQTGSRSLAFEAHMDTVGVQQMTIDPFTPDVRAGRIYGRGACDTKGSIAAFLTALRIAREQNRPLTDKICFIATMGEETGCEGAAALIEEGFRVDAIIVGEPTNCQLATAHKGALWLTIVAHGASGHAAMPERGRNAISTMARAITAMEEGFAPQLRQARHTLLGSPTLSVGTIRGGELVNVVPARCEASLDCRFLPGQDHRRIVEQLQNHLAGSLPGERFELADVKAYAPLDTPPNRPLVKKLLTVTREATGQTQPVGVNYFSDAGIETVLFGPGDPAQAHTADEFLDIGQLYRATEIALEWLARESSQSLVR